jgi:hypothetical protein
MIFLRPIYISLIIIRSPDRKLDYSQQGNITEQGGKIIMNLGFWIPAMFFLGIAVMGLCFLFMKACEKI